MTTDSNFLCHDVEFLEKISWDWKKWSWCWTFFMTWITFLEKWLGFVKKCHGVEFHKNDCVIKFHKSNRCGW